MGSFFGNLGVDFKKFFKHIENQNDDEQHAKFINSKYQMSNGSNIILDTDNFNGQITGKYNDLKLKQIVLDAVDLNIVTQAGDYYVKTNCTNIPYVQFFTMQTRRQNNDGNYVNQTLIGKDGRIFVRHSQASVWSEWREITTINMDKTESLTWIVPTLANGFTAYGDPAWNFKFAKDGHGNVFGRGLITPPTPIPGGVAILTLPVGYRPINNLMTLSTTRQANEIISIQIFQSGVVDVRPFGVASPGVWMSLSFSFKAEQ